jgi:hypothetical protein
MNVVVAGVDDRKVPEECVGELKQRAPPIDATASRTQSGAVSAPGLDVVDPI